MHTALVSLGLNPSNDELQSYLKLFDKDGDNKISQSEFAHVIKDIMRKEVMQADELMESIRCEFRKIANA